AADAGVEGQRYSARVVLGGQRAEQVFSLVEDGDGGVHDAAGVIEGVCGGSEVRWLESDGLPAVVHAEPRRVSLLTGNSLPIRIGSEDRDVSGNGAESRGVRFHQGDVVLHKVRWFRRRSASLRCPPIVGCGLVGTGRGTLQRNSGR